MLPRGKRAAGTAGSPVSLPARPPPLLPLPLPLPPSPRQVDPFGDLNTELERALGKLVKEKYDTGERWRLKLSCTAEDTNKRRRRALLAGRARHD